MTHNNHDRDKEKTQLNKYKIPGAIGFYPHSVKLTENDMYNNTT